MFSNLWHGICHWAGWDGVVVLAVAAVVAALLSIFTPIIAYATAIFAAVGETIPQGPFAELGAIGVLAWFCYYVTRHTIPRIIKEHREETKQLVSDFRADIRDERMARIEMMKTFRCQGVKLE